MKEPKLRMNSHERSTQWADNDRRAERSAQIYLHIFYRAGYSTNSPGSGFTRVGHMHEVLEG